ncbi:uncharacterized protein BKA55DRAFT_667023, partial [Fusarium redolens]
MRFYPGPNITTSDISHFFARLKLISFWRGTSLIPLSVVYTGKEHERPSMFDSASILTEDSAEGFAKPQNLYHLFQSPEITKQFPEIFSKPRVSVRENGSQISRISDLLPDLHTGKICPQTTPFLLITKLSLVTYDAFEVNYRRN